MATRRTNGAPRPRRERNSWDAGAGAGALPEPHVVPLQDPVHLSGRGIRDRQSNRHERSLRTPASLDAQLAANTIDSRIGATEDASASPGSVQPPQPPRQSERVHPVPERESGTRTRTPPGPIHPQDPEHPEERATHEFDCPQCGRAFSSKIGLGVHRRKAHPVEYNAEIDTSRRKARWTNEAMQLLAWEEVMAPVVPNLNDYLVERLDGVRSVEAIKGMRKQGKYKNIRTEVAAMAAARSAAQQAAGARPNTNAGAVPPARDGRYGIEGDTQPARGERYGHEGPFQPAQERYGNEGDIDTPTNDALGAWLRSAIAEVPVDLPGRTWLTASVDKALSGEDPESELVRWWAATLPPKERRQPRDGNTNENVANSSSARRRAEYRTLQTLWRKNQSKAAHKVLDGDNDGVGQLPMEVQEPFWREMLETRPPENTAYPELRGNAADHNSVWAPVTVQEVSATYPPTRSSAGPDGITVGEWKDSVPSLVQAIVMNTIMMSGRVPKIWRDSRTVLIPKKANAQEPSLYRPISISSVVLRHLHKILAKRMSALGLTDTRQRAFIEADGAAENIFVLASAIHKARAELSPLHMATLDVKKAFDTVNHKGIIYVLRKNKLPEDLIAYLGNLYSSSTTVLEVRGKRSEPIHAARGVRQGDPLSPLLFNLVINEVLDGLLPIIGVETGGVKINALAFADDLVLMASTADGLQRLLNATTEILRAFGLELMAAKCSALSLVPSGRDKKMKVATESLFVVDGARIPQLQVLDRWKYLGIVYDSRGLVASSVDFQDMLNRVKSAPLKPQQRWRVLTTYLLPRATHTLVLGRTTFGELRRLDKQVRNAVRTWLRLPHDTPVAFYHAPVKDGGLGIPALESSIPEIKSRRLRNLETSSLPAARAAAASPFVRAAMQWCRQATTGTKDWARRLHASTDGWELREARKSALSTSWFIDDYQRIPAREWIEDIRTRINALPSRMRTTRGTRRNGQEVMCRAGCMRPETTAHIIQECHRTHGGRIKRHDAVVKTIAAALMRKQFRVTVEKVYNTPDGRRKPDIVATKNGSTNIIDCQIVSGGRPLSDTNSHKKEYYAGNAALLREVARDTNVRPQNILVEAVTISWRGVWAAESDSCLRRLGLPQATMAGITTRVIQGSHLNFARFNQMTSMANGRQGVG